MHDSFLICIGLEKFLDKNISKLEYSSSDCYRIQRACNILNIAYKSNILLNEQATKLNIFHSLTNLDKDIKNLYLYISSHGARVDGQTYVYSYETKSDDLTVTAILLDNLLNFLNDLVVEKITVVIDACKIKLARKINDKITFFCSKKDLNFENTLHRQSLFTKGFIKYLSKFALNRFDSTKSLKYQKIRQDLLVISQSYELIYVYGPSGLGKSYFLKQIEQQEDNTFYISVPKIDSINYNIVLTLLSEKLTLSYENKFYNAIDADPERHIQFYMHIRPYSLIIIDHVDHLDKENTFRLSQFFDKIMCNKIIISRKINPNIKKEQHYCFPKLTKQDIQECIGNFAFSDKLANLKSIYLKSNYIDLLNDIYQHKEINYQEQTTYSKSDVQNIYHAIAITGGFINKELFSQIFLLNPKIIPLLINKGLIIENDSFFYPHDTVYKLCGTGNNYDILKNNALYYWKKEIISHCFTHNKALQSYILLLKTFDYKLNNSDTNFYIKLIFLLKGRQYTYYLIILYNYFLKKSPELPLLLAICESLIEIGKFDEVDKLISLSCEEYNELSALLIETLWWKGHFHECIQAANNFLRNQKQANVLCSRGIAYFFLGLWDKSSSDLKQVIKITSNSAPKQQYLSYCVLATTQGIRGTDFFSSVKNFISAINIAKKEGKLSWLALIYGNIGEILWKSEFFEESLDILTIAKHLAYLTDNDALLLEINRNLLHAYHKNKQHISFVDKLNEFSESLNYTSDTYVKMQIINTLITHYVFIKNNNYKHLIIEAIKLTRNNKEYYIYTLSNLAIIRLVEKNFYLACKTMTDALKLCMKGQNWLALKQCLDDWDTTLEVYQFSHLSTQLIFQKWHLILQKELLPNVHYLAGLYTFLRQI